MVQWYTFGKHFVVGVGLSCLSHISHNHTSQQYNNVYTTTRIKWSLQVSLLYIPDVCWRNLFYQRSTWNYIISKHVSKVAVLQCSHWICSLHTILNIIWFYATQHHNLQTLDASVVYRAHIGHNKVFNVTNNHFNSSVLSIALRHSSTIRNPCARRPILCCYITCIKNS